MNSDPLAELKPLIAPPPISWWPPAPGWWILAALVLLALVALLVFFYRRWRHHRNTSYQREATQLIDAVHTLPEAQQLQEVAEILRRAAVCAWGRERAGTNSWEQLIQFSRSEYSQRARKKTATPTLDETSCHLLSNNLYSGTPPSETAMQTLIAQSKAWLKTLPPVEQ
ncbi:MAG: DUF4381 domain-containing protein [Pseudomonadales bacterium]